jgi:hypothetical protein
MFDALPYEQEEGKEEKVQWAIFLKGLMGRNARLLFFFYSNSSESPSPFCCFD